MRNKQARRIYTSVLDAKLLAERREGRESAAADPQRVTGAGKEVVK